MHSTNSVEGSQVENPLNVIEQLVEINEWMFDRRGDHEMAVQAPGTWCDYSLYFAWNEVMEALHFTCAFDMRVASDQMSDMGELLLRINDELWIGHFCIWEDEGLPMFRCAIPLRGTKRVEIEQMEDMVQAGLSECERFYPAFQYVIWGGYGAEEAIQLSMIETVGEA